MMQLWRYILAFALGLVVAGLLAEITDDGPRWACDTEDEIAR